LIQQRVDLHLIVQEIATSYETTLEMMETDESASLAEQAEEEGGDVDPEEEMKEEILPTQSA
jgi:hypothetical protein